MKQKEASHRHVARQYVRVALGGSRGTLLRRQNKNVFWNSYPSAVSNPHAECNAPSPTKTASSQ